MYALPPPIGITFMETRFRLRAEPNAAGKASTERDLWKRTRNEDGPPGDLRFRLAPVAWSPAGDSPDDGSTRWRGSPEFEPRAMPPVLGPDSLGRQTLPTTLARRSIIIYSLSTIEQKFATDESGYPDSSSAKLRARSGSASG